MAHQTNRTHIARYLAVQTCLGVAVGLVFGIMMLAADVAGIGTLLGATCPGDALVFLASSVTTLCPFVIATAIGLLAFERAG